MISIVVLNWNGEKYLKDCLLAIQNQSFKDFEVIVVDNASTDSSVEFIKKNFKKMKIIQNKSNVGFCKGNNIGVNNSKGEYVFILNNDTKLDKNCLKELMKAADKNSEAGMLCPKMLFADTKKIDSIGLVVSKAGLSRDNRDPAAKPFCPCGGAAFYKRKMLEDIKLDGDYYDSDYFIYMEDYDLGFRAHLRGWDCISAPEAIVYHLHGATMKNQLDKSIYLGVRNRVWTILKNYPTVLIIRYIVYIKTLQFIIFLRYLFKGKIHLILKAYYDYLKALPRVFKKRGLIQKKRKITAEEISKLFNGIF